MKKPTAVVIEDSFQVRNALQKFLEKWGEENGIDFEVQVYERFPGVDKIKDASLFLIDYNLPGVHGLDVARELDEKGSLGARVMITGMGTGNILRDSINEGLFDAWLQKPFRKKEFEGRIDDLRKRRKIVQRISLGVVGLGELGRGIIRNAKGQSWVKRINGHTDFVEGDYGEVTSLIGLGGDDINKVSFGGLEEVISSEPDILFICTGEFGIDYGAYNDRNELLERLFEGSSEKIRPVLERLGNYDGLICIESNPNGALLYLAHSEYGIDASQLTSFSPDTTRHKTILMKELKEKYNLEYNYEDVFLIVIGEHGMEVPLYELCFVGGEPLLDICTAFRDPEYRTHLTKLGRGEGMKAMQAAQKLQSSYGVIPEEITKILHDMACLQEEPSFPIYSYLEDQDSFLNVLVSLNYPLRVKSRISSLEFLTGSLTRNNHVLSELQSQIDYQRSLVLNNT